MFRRLKKIMLNLILPAILVPVSSMYAETVEYDGLIEPYVVVDIGTPAQGIVDRVTVDRSSSVKKGQTLVVMESSVERAVLAKAKAMASFKSEIGLQKTHLKQAQEQSALANFELKKAQAIVNRCWVKSPISGVVVERFVSPGEYVDGQPLLRVAQIDPLRVEVIVPAQMFGRIIPGLTATIVPELPEYGEQIATVTIVDKLIDAASSTFGVRLELPNAERCRAV